MEPLRLSLVSLLLKRILRRQIDGIIAMGILFLTILYRRWEQID
jgi:hypothetical protein